MLILAGCTCAQAIYSDSHPLWNTVFTAQQVATYAIVVCLTRMHQTRNMGQPTYCTSLYVLLSVLFRAASVLIAQSNTLLEMG
jgi:hypothetical protein